MSNAIYTDDFGTASLLPVVFSDGAPGLEMGTGMNTSVIATINVDTLGRQGAELVSVWNLGGWQWKASDLTTAHRQLAAAYNRRHVTCMAGSKVTIND